MCFSWGRGFVERVTFNFIFHRPTLSAMPFMEFFDWGRIFHP